MLGNAAPTPYDLRFEIFGIPVRVHPFFWVLSAFLGWNPRNPQMMVVWVLCVFFSILVHELGHALTARHFGWPPEIVLYSFGGYASFHPTWGYTTRRAVLILLAGPGAGFPLYAAIKGLELVLIRTAPEIPFPPLIAKALDHLVFINLWWGLVNLLPVYPLDGGQISRHLLGHWRPYDGVPISLKLSLLVAGGLAVYFLMHQQQYNGILFGLLALQSWQALQGSR